MTGTTENKQKSNDDGLPYRPYETFEWHAIWQKQRLACFNGWMDGRTDPLEWKHELLSRFICLAAEGQGYVGEDEKYIHGLYIQEIIGCFGRERENSDPEFILEKYILQTEFCEQ